MTQNLYDLMAPGPDWPDDAIFDEYLVNLNVIRADMDTKFLRAKDDYDRGRRAYEEAAANNVEPWELSALDPDPDELLATSELARQTDIAFFLLAAAHFDWCMIRRREWAEEVTRRVSDAAGRGTLKHALKYFDSHPDIAVPGDFTRTIEVINLRNRLLHDGTRWTERIEQEVPTLIQDREVHQAYPDRVWIEPDAIDRYVSTFRDIFIAVSAAIRLRI